MERTLNPETLAALESCAEPGDGFVPGLLATYLEDVPARLDAARAAQRAGDAPGFARVMHTLKGSSMNVGADALAFLAQALEGESKRGRLPPGDGLEPLAAAYAQVRAAIAAYLDRRAG
jgi:HPt (histidine-containing phosphotransfer) domain-containing protein